MNKVASDVKKIIGYSLTALTVLGILVLTIAAAGIKAQAETSKKVIRVAYNIQPGLTELDDRGNYSGYSYEYLIKIAQFTGWKYEFVEIEGKRGSSDILSAMEMVKNGKLDLIGGLVKNDELQRSYEYPQKNYGVGHSTLSALESCTEIDETNYMQYKPLRIAVQKNAKIRNKELETFLKQSNIEYILVNCENAQDQYYTLQNNAADVMLGVTLSPTRGTKQLVRFNQNPYYFVTAKGNTEITKAIDEAIAKINEADPYYETRLFDKYFGTPASEFYLSDKEKKYVEQQKELNVLVIPKLAPFSFLNDKREASGMSYTILNEIGENTGLKINYTVLKDKKDTSKEIATGKYDIVFGMEGKDTIATEYGLVMSQPYIDVGLSFFYNQAALSTVDSENVLAVTRGVKVLQSLDYKKIKRYPTIEDSMQAVEEGDADFGYANSYSIDFYTMQKNFSHLQVIPITGQTESIGFAITNYDDIELLSILNKYIRTLTGKHLDSHLLRSVSTINKGTVSAFIESNTSFVVVSISLFLLSVTAAVFLGYINVENKRKNSQLQEAYAVAEQANKAKTEFLARMSHEMRTPLSAVISMTGLARESAKNEVTVVDSLDKIDIASKHLLQLINDVLDITKINEGKLSVHNAPFDFKNLMTSVEIVYAEYSREKEVSLFFSTDEKLCPYVVGDALRIKQIIINLLSNAIKYNVKGGKVNISVVVLEQGEDSEKLRISVSDTGVGISKQRQDAIFEAFERETFADTSAIEGTGLGLSISQKIARLMDSEIKLTSSLSSGSDFYFDITLPTADKKEAESKTKAVFPIDLQGRNFMVVDDNKINVLILEKMLVKLGAQVETANNGEEAVDKFSKSEQGSYDGIFMDIRMPFLDGYGATYKIRNMNRQDSKTVKIIAVSANAFTEDVEKSIECGMNGHLAKPIDLNALYGQLEKFSVEKAEFIE